MFTQTEGWKRWNSVYIRGVERQLAESCIGKTCYSFIHDDYRSRARELGLVLCECGKSWTALGNRSDGGGEIRCKRLVVEFENLVSFFPGRRVPRGDVRLEVIGRAISSWRDQFERAMQINREGGGKLTEAASKYEKCHVDRSSSSLSLASRFNDPWNEPRWGYCYKSPRI